MKQKNSLRMMAACAAAMLALSGCSAVGNLVNNAVGGGGSAVSTLWPDVPAPEAATKANLDLPLPVKLAVQGMVKASAQNSDVKLDNFDFIAFSTKKSPDDVAAFYTTAKMQAQGWNVKDAPGCAAGAGQAGGAAGAGFCFFAKQGADGKTGSALIIVMAQEDKSKDTQLFFVRFDGTNTKTK